MIVSVREMKEIENNSGYSCEKLIHKVAVALNEQVQKDTKQDDRILILCGKGNNGADGLELAHILQTTRNVSIQCIEEDQWNSSMKKRLQKVQHLKVQEPVHYDGFDVFIDAIYGFSYHGSLKENLRSLFKTISNLHKKVLSIDINSGCEADGGHIDEFAINSDITYALQCKKIFHCLQKEHQVFKEVKVIDLGLHQTIKPNIQTMDETSYFLHMPKKKVNDYKGSNGHTLLIGGCYGMAGALCLNVLGARTIGTSYLHVGLEDTIYPILAGYYKQPVYHPFSHQSYYDVLKPLIESSKSIGFGSGAVYMPHKKDILDIILQSSSCPVVLDAEALKLLVHNTYLLRFAKCPIILTPHIKEFADLCNTTVANIKDHPIDAVTSFVKDYHVNVVLKGANTICAFTNGHLYINQSGNQALATAGSGDVLTGMMTSCLTSVTDVETAVMMSVYMHGHLADLALQSNSMQNFEFDCYYDLMNKLYMKHGY